MKGFEWSINLLVAVILLVVAIGLFWSAINPAKTTLPESKPLETETCKTDDDCIDNPSGAKCLAIYPSDFSPFCGCLTNEDCINRKSGICDSNNKCM